MKTLRTTVVSGFGERWTIRYDQRDGSTAIDDGSFTMLLGRFGSYRDGVARALSAISPNPRWSAERKREAERGATLKPVARSTS